MGEYHLQQNQMDLEHLERCLQSLSLLILLGWTPTTSYWTLRDSQESFLAVRQRSRNLLSRLRLVFVTLVCLLVDHNQCPFPSSLFTDQSLHLPSLSVGPSHSLSSLSWAIL